MKQQLCRFKDRNELLTHIKYGADAVTLDFVSPTPINRFESLSIVMVVSDVREQSAFTARVKRKRRVGLDGTTAVWAYTVEIDDADAVWVRMFVNKVQTIESVWAA